MACAALVCFAGCTEIGLDWQTSPKPETRLGATPVSPPRAPDTPKVAAKPSGSDPAENPTAHFPKEFQLTSMRGTSHSPYLDGNTRQAIRTAHLGGIRYVEVDLVSTRDGHLVTAHQSHVKGCGMLHLMQRSQVQGCKLKGSLQVAELREVLNLPFAGIFLDLKDTLGTDRALGARAVQRAASAVVEQRRVQDTVLMVYETDQAIVEPLLDRGLRVGLKGYPKSVAEARDMVHRASRAGLEMLSVNTEFVTPALLEESAKLGIWHLPWSTDPRDAQHWRALAQAGAGGLIVLHFELAKQQVLPHWVDARTLDL